MYKEPSKATKNVILAQAVETAYDCLMRHVETLTDSMKYYQEQIDERAKAAADCGEEFELFEEYYYGELLRATAMREIYAAVAEDISKL